MYRVLQTVFTSSVLALNCISKPKPLLWFDAASIESITTCSIVEQDISLTLFGGPLVFRDDLQSVQPNDKRDA